MPMRQVRGNGSVDRHQGRKDVLHLRDKASLLKGIGSVRRPDSEPELPSRNGHRGLGRRAIAVSSRRNLPSQDHKRDRPGTSDRRHWITLSDFESAAGCKPGSDRIRRSRLLPSRVFRWSRLALVTNERVATWAILQEEIAETILLEPSEAGNTARAEMLRASSGNQNWAHSPFI
jgi:hypothetical protein